MPAVSVRRWGMGSPERRGEPLSPSLTRLGFLAEQGSGDGVRAAPSLVNARGLRVN
jgi:hypothetical protein